MPTITIENVKPAKPVKGSVLEVLWKPSADTTKMRITVKAAGSQQFAFNETRDLAKWSNPWLNGVSESATYTFIPIGADGKDGTPAVVNVTLDTTSPDVTPDTKPTNPTALNFSIKCNPDGTVSGTWGKA